VAFRYFLGARGSDLGAPLGDTPEAAALTERLTHADRERRAETLALEIGRVVRALEARSIR
jgi:hypothetical protein